MRSLKVSFFLVFLLSNLQISFSQASISGELRKWHAVTLEFDGPNVSEGDSKNPFLDYRLNVTFTAPSGETFVVPGFFNADGNAAETSATSGNQWAVRFAPNQTGSWSYKASFRTGSNVAVNSSANAGSGTSFDGASGNFSIASNNKSLPDNRAKGRLSYVGERYLKFEETDKYFLKAGADSPENMLAYNDFDNTVGSKSWAPHSSDYNSGDVTWKDGKGRELIGAINYLSEQGMNVFSFLTMNIKGDGKDVWPYAASSNNALDGDSGSDAQNRLRFDVSKLEQWEILFAHADKKGMYLHFKTQEQENDQLLDGGSLGTQRRLYYRELIARFGHHLALNWNIGEENTQTTQQRKDCAQFFKDNDPYNHHVVLHTFPGDKNSVYPPLLGNASAYTGPSIQTKVGSIHDDVKKWVLESEQAGKPWVVANDEQGNAQRGVTADASYSGNKGSEGDNRTDVREDVLWGTLMAGGAGVEYYFGYSTGETDLTAQDFRSRKTKWEDAKIALDFFNQNLPFWEMDTNDQLTSDSDDFCFADIGETYSIYLPNGGSTNLNLSSVSGNFSVQWFNPRSGGNLSEGSVSQITGGGTRNIGNPPNNSNSDWVVLVKKTDGDDGGDDGGGDEAECTSGFVETNGLVVIEAENLETPSGWSQKTEASGFTGNGYIEWLGGDNFGSPGNGVISTTIKINTTGTYLFEWRNKVGEGTNTTESNDSWLRFPDADDFFGEKSNGSIVYPKGSGKSPAPAGSGSNGWFKVYTGGTTNWNFSSSTSDNDPHKIYVTFDSPGTYTLEISGRSDHHLIDRIVLSQDGINGRTLSLPETPCDDSDDDSPVAVSGVQTSPGQVTLNVGDSANINAQVSPSNASNKALVWSSSDSQVASVNANGRVTAEKTGNAVITATTQDGGFKDTTNVTVEEVIDNGDNTVPVTGVGTDSNIRTVEFAPFTIAANVRPSNASNKDVVWESSDTSVATIDQNGLVTPLKAGKVEIVLTTVDGGFRSDADITIKPGDTTPPDDTEEEETQEEEEEEPDNTDPEEPVENQVPVTGVGTDSNIRTVEFEPFTIKAIVRPSNATNQSVVWESRDTSVATVDQNGLVTPLKAGKVEIEVTTVEGGFVSDADITIKPGDTTPPNDAEEEETEEEETEEEEEPEDTDPEEPVENEIPVTGIYTDSNIRTVEFAPFTIRAIVSPSNATEKSVVWESRNTSIATVDQNGLVTPLKAGKVEIAVTTVDGGFISDADITIKPGDTAQEQPEDSTPTDEDEDQEEPVENYIPVTGIYTNSNIRTVDFGAPFVIKAIISPSNATNTAVTWVSSDPSVATVDDKGVVTPLRPGKVEIVVTTDDGGFVSDADITIKNNGSSRTLSIKASPNPARSGATISLSGIQNGRYSLVIVSSSGTVVSSKSVEINGTYELRPGNLTRGMYIVNALGTEGNYTTKILIE